MVRGLFEISHSENETNMYRRHFPCSLFKDSNQGLKYQTKEALPILLYTLLGKKPFSFLWGFKSVKTLTVE